MSDRWKRSPFGQAKLTDAVRVRRGKQQRPSVQVPQWLGRYRLTLRHSPWDKWTGCGARCVWEHFFPL